MHNIDSQNLTLNLQILISISKHIYYMPFIRFTFLLFASIIIYQTSFSQVPRQLDSNNLEIQEIIPILERINSIVIFYQPQWFEGKKFSSSILDLSLHEALDAITHELFLTTLSINGYIVIVPDEGSQERTVSRDGDYFVVGNPLEMGRYAQASIEGHVHDGATGKPLAGAIVYVESTGIGSTTNSSGVYSIILPVGDSKIKLSYLGYEDSYQNIRVIAPGKVDFELFEKSVQLEGATITAFRKDANITGTQMSMIKFNPLMLKEIPGALGERDIIKSFTLLPGIQSTGEFGTGFNVRGGGADQNLILVEEMPLFNSSHLFGLVSVVNPDMVTGVTLIKAGIPARYGERASSVVDIRKRGGNPERTKFTGGLGLLYSRLHVETPLFNRKVFLSIGGRSSYSNWLLKQIPDVDLMNSSASFYDLSGVVTFNINSRNSLSIFGYQSEDNFFFNNETKHKYTNRLASLRLNSEISPIFTSRFTFGMSQYINNVEQPVDIEPRTAFNMASSVDYGTIKWLFDYKPSGNHVYDFGIQAIGYSINPGEISPIGETSFIDAFNLDSEKGVEMAAFVSGNFEITPSLSAEVGLRAVGYSLLGPSKIFTYQEGVPRTPESIVDTTFFEGNWESAWSDFGLEPRVGLRFLLSQNSSIKVSYNRNNQFVNLLSNSAVMSPTDVWRLSNKFTGAMVGDQVALGYYQIFPEQGIEVSIESYYKSLRNIVEYRDGANILMNKYIETDIVNASGYNYGIELYATKKLGAVSGWISYTWSRTMRRTNEEFDLLMINNNAYFPSSFDKPHNLVVNSTYRITRRWRINANFTYNTGRPITYPEQVFDYQGHQAIFYSDRNKYRLPDYHRLDLSLSFDENLKLNARGKGSWTLSIINVYGRKNAYSVFYKKERPSMENNYQKYSLYKLYIIGRPLPSLTYNFTF
jgi:hypothetical protein